MSLDVANQQLLQALNEAPDATLWWVDENVLSFPTSYSSQLAITNRFDVYQQLKALGWNVFFSDFDASPVPDSSLDCALLRLPKEKALVHFLINQSARLLKPGGELWLIGDKNEGIRGFTKRATTRLGGRVLEQKISGGLWFAKIVYQPDLAGAPLDDQHYTEPREVLDKTGERFISKPGVYGWQKIDPGSSFLIKHLSDMLHQPLPLEGKILDLGCGYGYLSLQVAGHSTQLTCTDNNAAALTCCKANLEALSINAKVLASDAGDILQEQYDTVICNPPFHSGFATNTDLTDRFAAAASRCLNPSGQACFVVNKHIGLEQKASAYFGNIKLHVENNHFKLIHLSQPKLT